ncbi:MULTISPECIES: DUF3828 domain-containing protein [Chelatococcus]|uniref:DUF3828 domain-containing protein n=1 Tax=Chelatococcus caeni TaxID=1348468 RepID=A0A840BWD2_9HYPH|nr:MULTISPECIES: DUF3828 domain-containing protein [Chelatococcus]MBB4016022.1 hypothetical protein [Chelatococcus caeni]
MNMVGLSRRTFLAAVALVSSAPAMAAAGEPDAVVRAIYDRAAQGQGDEGGMFLFDEAVRRRNFSSALDALWRKAEAIAEANDEPVLDFDPVTNSQDPDVKSFTVASEARTDATALLAVTLTGRFTERARAADAVVRYVLILEDGSWRIDDLRGSVDGEAWSLREILKQRSGE